MDSERQTALTGHGVSKRFGKKWAVENVDITVGVGIHGLLGNNGAGKSTLIKILATLIPPSRGSVRFGSLIRPRHDHFIRKQLGYLPQQYGLMEHLTAREYLFYACRMKGGTSHDMDFSPDSWLERVGLQDAAHLRVRRLSGGMKQRLAIAQAFMGRPRLVILDEPTAGLDPDERVRFRNLLQEVGQTAAVLLSTHIVSDVEQVAQSLTIMHLGHVVATGDAEGITARAHGRVYELTLSQAEWESQRAFWMDRHGPTPKGVVANIVQDHGSVRIRLVSDDPPVQAHAVDDVGLEDGYLATTALQARP